jgi:hypothetical protein
MSKSKSEKEKRVDLYLQDLSLTNVAIYELLQAIRNQILGVKLASNETVKEEVKYGGILFAVEQAFCGVFAYANHVSLEFGEGASLLDQFNVLEGKGKFRRHIKLTSIEEIESKHVMHYVNLACQHSQTS